MLGALSADACTGFYVGKKVSADGTTMLGRTVDAAPWNGPMYLSRFERGERSYADGTANGYAFTCAAKSASIGVGFYGGGAINEKGVMLTATVTGRTREAATDVDPFKPVSEGGVGEPNLPDYMIGNAATAREAVELLGKAIADHGHAGPEIYMVADTDETWYIEVYTGHEWAAVRMPEDQVAVFGNQFNIREFNTNDTENVMYSPNLVGLAETHGFVVWKDEPNGVIDLYKTYSPPLFDYANYRTYWGHHAWAPSVYGESYATENVYPLLFVPDSKIAISNVFEMMRTRFEGVNCPDENGDTSVRVIGTTKQMSCHVLQMRHDLPENYRCTLWECLAQAEHSTFVPVCMAVKEIPDAYSRDHAGQLAYDPLRAADAFLRLDTLAELKRFVVDTYGNRQDVRPFYGAGVRESWRTQEARLVAEWPAKLEAWSAQDMNAGSIAASAYVNFNQLWTLAEAKRLHDELAWYWAEFNCDLRDGGGATDVPTYPFASSMPTNAEMGVSWTRWHRAEFDAYVEDLAGPAEMRSAEVTNLVEVSKCVFDGVRDSVTLATAKAAMADIVLGITRGREGPPGSECNPWQGGESVVVWTNGTGTLVFEGAGPTDEYVSETEQPWSEVMSDVTSARVAGTVTLGANSLKGISSSAPVNGLVPSALFAAVGGLAPAGAISPAEFERVDIIDGKAYLDVSVYTSDTITDPNWSVATNGVIEVPAPGRKGFFYLQSKPAGR